MGAPRDRQQPASAACWQWRLRTRTCICLHVANMVSADGYQVLKRSAVDNWPTRVNLHARAYGSFCRTVMYVPAYCASWKRLCFSSTSAVTLNRQPCRHPPLSSGVGLGLPLWLPGLSQRLASPLLTPHLQHRTVSGTCIPPVSQIVSHSFDS